MLDMILSDIPKFGLAEFPCPLLTKVAIVMMPLIDCLEHFLPGQNNAAWLNGLRVVLADFKPFQHLTWFEVSRSPDLL